MLFAQVPLPDLAQLNEAGGWVVAVAVVVGVIALVVTGRLVPGPSHDREVVRGDKQDDRLDSMTELLHGVLNQLRVVTALLEDRRRERDDVDS